MKRKYALISALAVFLLLVITLPVVIGDTTNIVGQNQANDSNSNATVKDGIYNATFCCIKITENQNLFTLNLTNSTTDTAYNGIEFQVPSSSFTMVNALFMAYANADVQALTVTIKDGRIVAVEIAPNLNETPTPNVNETSASNMSETSASNMSETSASNMSKTSQNNV